MFGDERGGGTNVRYGLKPMKNAEAQEQYYQEVGKVVRDLNMRFIRARLPELSLSDAEALLEKLLADGGNSRGISWEELVHRPHRNFFRRRGVPAFEMVGWDGEAFDDAEAYLRHLTTHLPDGYRAGRDFKDYAQMIRRVHAGELTRDEAAQTMPSLRRVGGVCPCSRAVRWVAEEPDAIVSGGSA